MPPIWVRIGVLAVFVSAVVVVISACGNGVAENRTGIGEVDQVLDAVESGDAEQIEALVSFGQRPCRRLEPGVALPAGVSNIDCPGNEPEGTLVDAFWSGSCEGKFWFPADLGDARRIAARLVEMNLDLYGVYESRVVESEFWVNSEYTVLYEWDHDGVLRGHMLHLKDGGLVGTDEDCGFPAAQMAEGLGNPIILD